MADLNLSTELSTILALFAFVIACAGVWFSVSNRTSRQIYLLRRDLRREIDEHEAQIVLLNQKWKKANANYALLLARAKLASTDEIEEDDEDTRQKPGETGAEWKMRMRKAIASGKVKPSH